MAGIGGGLLEIVINQCMNVSAEFKTGNVQKRSEFKKFRKGTKRKERKRKERGRSLWGIPNLWALHRSSIDFWEHTHSHSRSRKPGACREFVLLWIRVVTLHWTSTHWHTHNTSLPPAAPTHTHTNTLTKSLLITSLTADAPAVWEVKGHWDECKAAWQRECLE